MGSVSISVNDLEHEQGDEPLLEGRVKKETDAGWEYQDLSDAAAHFYVKSSEDDPDANALVHYTLADQVSFPDAPNGAFQVQCNTQATATTGRFFYKFVVVLSGYPQTVARGVWIVR